MRFLSAVTTIAASCAVLFATYTYTPYFTDSLTSINNSNWTSNGSLTAGSGGLTSSATNGGSLISKVAVPDGTSDYEVDTTLKLTQSGGTYVTYLRATPTALSGPGATGTTYSFEVQNPTFSGSACSATLVAYRIVSGSATSLASTGIPCSNGMVIRCVYSANTNQIGVFVNNGLYFWTEDSTITSGQPGIGVRSAPSSNSISQVSLFPIYTGTPVMPPVDEIGVSAFANKVEMQWPDASDGSGPGVAGYNISRNSSWMGAWYLGEQLEDPTVSAGTPYTYTIQAFDFHLNDASVSVSLTTPPAGSIDPRETGVRPTGSYWGGAGEQIDSKRLRNPS